MKRKGNIYEKICTFDNCKLAIIKASKNKKYRNDVNCIMNNIVSGKRKAVVTKTKKYNKNLAILYKNILAR